VARLAWENTGNGDSHLAGMLAASSPHYGVSWLRLVAVTNDTAAKPVLSALLDAITAELRAQTCHTVLVMVTRPWLAEYLPALGFTHHDDVVTFRRDAGKLPARPPASVTIHPVTNADTSTLLKIDHSAFAPPWRLTSEEMLQALRLAHCSTAALRDAQIVGYQLSTGHHQAGHLARLAVIPSMQGQGIGSVLVHDLIQRLARQNIHTLTVNTQLSNRHSQSIYTRYGFTRNGYDVPVWVRQLTQNS